MGRMIASTPRTLILETAEGLDKRFKAALKDLYRRDAFDQLYSVWGDETAAAIHQMGSDGFYRPIHLLLLMAIVDNRRELIELREENQRLREQLERPGKF